MRYSFKTKPYDHQRRALLKLLPKARGGGLFMEMGTGKTKVAIDYACIKFLANKIDQVLVVAPLSVLGVWEVEVRKHSTCEDLNFKTINYDKLPITHYFQQLLDYCRQGRTLMICDEGHKLKNPQSKRSKAAYALSKRCVACIVMTGTPIAKNPLDLFGEMRVVDDSILGSSWGIFKKTYAMWGGYGGYQLIKLMNMKGLRKRVDPHIFITTKEECLDLPKRTHEIVPVDLRKSRRFYEQMARESVVEFEDGSVAEAPIVLTRLLRLSQVTGGWIKADDKYQEVGREKREALDGILGDMAEQERQKIVIFVRFLTELRDCAHVAASHGYKVLPFFGGVKKSQRDQRIAQFEEANEPTVFVAQIQAGSLGISLTAASEAIFYSHTYDYAEFAQACDRLHRIGQRRAVTYYHLIARDTVDEAVWLALKTKRNIAELVLQKPELLV